MNLTRPVVVVDRRTYRNARKKITVFIDHGDDTRAKLALTAAMPWLRYEIRTGTRRHRVRYAAGLEQLEALEAEVNGRLGLTG